MTIKITKQLATMEDLAIGSGTVVQERNGVLLTLNKIDFTSNVTSIAFLEGFIGEKGLKVSTASYHKNSTRGGGTFVWSTGRHNGGIFIDPNRTFPDFSDETEKAAWYLDSGIDVNGWKLIFDDVVNVLQMGAGGDAGFDDTKSLQACIDYVIDTDPSFPTQNPIYLPYGRYVVSSTLKVPSGANGFTLFSDSQGTATIDSGFVGAALQIGDDGWFTGGDTLGLVETTRVTIKDIFFRSTNVINDTVAIKGGYLRKSFISRCLFENYNVAIDLVKANSVRFTDLEFSASARTNTDSGIRLQGALNTQNSYQPGGNLFFDNCNFRGAENTAGNPDSWIRIHSVDGFYMTNCHFQFSRYAITTQPLDAAANRIILDLKISNCYFDNPIGSNNSNVLITGTSFPQTKYRQISFYGCLFRGANVASHGIDIDVVDGGSGTLVTDITASDCIFKQHVFAGVRVRGTSTTGNLAIGNVAMQDCIFKEANFGGTSSYGAFNGQLEQLTFTGNVVKQEQNQVDNSLRFTPEGSFSTYVVSGNSFYNSDYSLSAFIATSQADVGEYSGNTDKTQSFYERGVFTVTLTGGATTSPTTTGEYIKIGDMVTINMLLQFGSVSLNGTALTISGIPFASSGSSIAIAAGELTRTAFNAGAIQSWFMEEGATVMALREVSPGNSSTTPVNSSIVTANGVFGRLSFSYFIN